MFARVEIVAAWGRVPIGETKRSQKVQRFQQKPSTAWRNSERAANTESLKTEKCNRVPVQVTPASAVRHISSFSSRNSPAGRGGQ